jgi:hypothetical protein
MRCGRPEPEQFWRAVEIYLHHAYGDAAIPNSVNQRLQTLRAVPPGDLYTHPSFERIDGENGPLSLRLGNRFYLHMKLVIECAPIGSGPLLRADTHDRHIAPPPGSPAHDAFASLMVKNGEIATAIEAAWTEAGLPTFKQMLRDDLKRRGALRLPTT